MHAFTLYVTQINISYPAITKRVIPKEISCRLMTILTLTITDLLFSAAQLYTFRIQVEMCALAPMMEERKERGELKERIQKVFTNSELKFTDLARWINEISLTYVYMYVCVCVYNIYIYTHISI